MNRVMLALLVALVGGGLLLGFLQVGGPGYARAERDDRDRARHLQDLGHHYACTLDQGGALTKECAGAGTPPDNVDPATGEPYRFTRLDENSFEVCATFRTTALQNGPAYVARSLVFAGDEGCLRYRRQGEGNAWIQQ